MAIQSTIKFHFVQVIGLVMCLVLSTTMASSVAASESVGPQQINKAEITRKGVRVEFKATAVGPDSANRPILAGEFARLEFTVTGAEDGKPLQRVYPGVWADLAQTADGERPGVSLECNTRVGQYMQGLVGMRPMIALRLDTSHLPIQAV